MQYIVLECNLRVILDLLRLTIKRFQNDIFEVDISVNDKQLKHDKLQREWKIFKSVLFTLTFLPMTWFLMKFR